MGLFVVNLRPLQWIGSKTILGYARCIVVAVLLYIIPLLLISTVNYLSDLRPIIMTLMFVGIGYSSGITDKQLKYIVIEFLALAIFMGISQVIINIGAFVIADQYLASAKTRIACLFSTGIVISFAYCLDKNETATMKVFFAVCALLLSLILVTIRGRSGMFSTFVVAVYMVWYKVRSNGMVKLLNKNKYFFIYFAVILLLLIPFYDTIYDYIYNSIFANKESDLGSGRGERNMGAIEWFLTYPFFGQMGTSESANFGWVHNYLLRVLSSYGITVGGFLTFIYFFLLVKVFRVKKNRQPFEWHEFGSFVMLIPFIISIFEPTYPYGPGKTVFLPFFLLGLDYFKVEHHINSTR